MNDNLSKPHVFISYSWSSPEHQALIKDWAEHLIHDGIEVIFDLFDLKEGSDKYVFMEKMVTDPTVTHVLVFSDYDYSVKANARKAGVGTESQIISHEIYKKVEETKFIPIVCGFSEEGEPFLPVFLKSRKWIDFSSPEAVMNNWEQLIRLLYNRPLHEKPELGIPPAYIRQDRKISFGSISAKFYALKKTIQSGGRGINTFRKDFINECIRHVNRFRATEDPKKPLDKKALEDFSELKPVRDFIIEWIFIETDDNPAVDFYDPLQSLLEQLLEMKSRPPEINSWNPEWYAGISIFVYETFLYIVGALISASAFDILHRILTTHYLLPIVERNQNENFCSFEKFYYSSNLLQKKLAPEGQRLYGPIAKAMIGQADRMDIDFKKLMEAELLIFLMALISDDSYWYPQTLFYAGYRNEFQFFLRASRHNDYRKLEVVTGIHDVKELNAKILKGYERLGVKTWSDFHSCHFSFSTLLNLDNLDSID